MLPRRIAARVGARPAAPVIAAIVQSAASAAASTTAAGPAADLHAGAGQRLRAGPRSTPGRLITARSALQRDRLLGQQRARCGRRPAPDAKPVRTGGSSSTVWVPTLPVLPRTVTVRRGASCGHSQSTTPRPHASASRAAAGAGVSRPSSRSSKPPWPGISAAGVLAPRNRRLTSALQQVARLRHDTEHRGDGNRRRTPTPARKAAPPATPSQRHARPPVARRRARPTSLPGRDPTARAAARRPARPTT